MGVWLAGGKKGEMLDSVVVPKLGARSALAGSYGATLADHQKGGTYFWKNPCNPKKRGPDYYLL